jgi:hypothetical protein
LRAGDAYCGDVSRFRKQLTIAGRLHATTVVSSFLEKLSKYFVGGIQGIHDSLYDAHYQLQIRHTFFKFFSLKMPNLFASVLLNK